MKMPLRRERDRARARRLFLRTRLTPEQRLLRRLALAFGLLLLVILVFWLDRAGLRDNRDEHVSFSDVVYFTMVTITTVGYGDIVPVSDRARVIDALFLTPIRLFLFFIFFGTAYELVAQRIVEDYRMRKIRERLSGHVVLFGYGHSGRIAAKELVATGQPPEQIVVIDSNEDAVRQAADAGLIGLRGDATSEALIREARVAEAKAAIVSTGRDDTTVLAVLTLRHLCPRLRIIASVREEENVKLVRQSGAHVIVTPSRIGGYLLAESVSRQHAPDYVCDLLTAGRGVYLAERPARPDEAGRPLWEVADGLVVRILRGGRAIDAWRQRTALIEAGDTLLLIQGSGRDPEALA